MMRNLLFSLVLGLFAVESAFAIPFTGTVYEQGSDKKKVLFKIKRDETVSGSTITAKARFTDPEGKEAVYEEAVIENGGTKIVKYVVERKQNGEHGRLDVKDGKVYFSWTTADGKTETEDEDAKPNLIVGPTTVPYLHAHWEELMKGDNVDVRFAALERKETVGFKYFKIGEVKWNGKDAVQIKMKPSSFVIAAIVSPLIFTFEKAPPHHLLELNGRTVPKRKDGDKWKDLDADTVYEYAASEAASTPAPAPAKK